MKPSVKFVTPDRSVFFPTLRKRVNQYFSDNNITRFGNSEMVIKTIVLLSFYILSYILVLTLPINVWFLLPFAIFMGISKAGIGMSVMHDALHGSYSKKVPVNQWVGYSIYLLGANAVVWKVHHNVLHHTYTNVHGLDEDIDNKAIIRLSYQAPLKKVHRYQHVYAFLLYGFLTIRLILSDLIKLNDFYRMGAMREKSYKHWLEYIKLVTLKLVYLFFIIALPILVTPLLWWQVTIGILAMHLVAGYILSVIFQMAHIVEGAQQPMLNEDGNIENSWAIHQLQTTANFSRNSRILNWYIGGLNYQIEHHLFPNICHVHYRKISAIVEKTATEFQLPYNVKPTFMNALASHVRMLKTLGRISNHESVT